MRMSFSFLPAIVALALVALPMAAFAVDPYPPILCNGLFGCGSPAENVLLNYTLPTAAMVLIQLAAGGAVIAIVLAGVQMVLSYADEGKVSNARKSVIYTLGGLALAFSATSIVSFVATEDYGVGGGIVGVMANAIRIIMILFNVAFALVVILAGMRMVTAGGNEEEFRKGAQVIKWAIVGAVIVNVARAGVQAFIVLNF
jgi:hypothetical protein